MQAPIRNTLLGATFTLFACAVFAQTPTTKGADAASPGSTNAAPGPAGTGASSTPAATSPPAAGATATKPHSGGASVSGKSASSAKSASHKHAATHHQRTMARHEAAPADVQEVAYRSALRQCVSGPQDRRDNCIDQTLTRFGRG